MVAFDDFGYFIVGRLKSSQIGTNKRVLMDDCPFRWGQGGRGRSPFLSDFEWDANHSYIIKLGRDVQDLCFLI
jgi:hypothetical protein